ncbi:MAG: polyprenyl diphosphate synthase [Dehalococcoidales bacterium]|nr:polyprenyl diphosphate synthase [Dehalococcoidales bacterium]
MAEAALSHVAIIPDGNRRWAAIKGVCRYEGHMAGANRIHDVVAELIKLQVKYLTLWGFSTDNWKRTPEEIQDIFALLQLWIEKDTPWLHENGIRLRHIGRFHQLPLTLQHAIGLAVDLTAYNQGMTLNLAFNYSGRAEIVDAVRRMLDDRVPQDLVDEELFSRYLYTNSMPDVDLVIRTADELRVSNFMLWQTAYSEFYFTPVFWPDFDAIELEKALQAYTERKRRFGGD